MDLLIGKGDELGFQPFLFALFENNIHKYTRIAIFSHASGDP
jgi:hypothetical protein